jgi:hypothetical protein
MQTLINSVISQVLYPDIVTTDAKSSPVSFWNQEGLQVLLQAL